MTITRMEMLPFRGTGMMLFAGETESTSTGPMQFVEVVDERLTNALISIAQAALR